MFTNLILNTDSYKASHFLQYPAGTQVVSSYIESRGGEFPQTLFFGLQAFIKEYLLKPVTTADIDEAEALFAAHGVPFFRQGWEQIVQQHGGFLPKLRIMYGEPMHFTGDKRDKEQLAAFSQEIMAHIAAMREEIEKIS